MASLVTKVLWGIIIAFAITSLISSIRLHASFDPLDRSWGPQHPEVAKLGRHKHKHKHKHKHDNDKRNKKAAEVRQPIKPHASGHQLGGLSCEVYGGPDDKVAAEMVYWSDIPEDSNYISPFYDENAEEKYMTFEPDGGGWNNIRMAMETVIVMAHAMGRTLVLPPDQKFYLLGKKPRGVDQKVHFSFADFFHLDTLDNEHDGLKIISMEEFLQRTAMQGRLVHKDTGKVEFPPGNRTDWHGLAQHEKELYEYLRNVTHVRNWKPDRCLAVFPRDRSKESVSRLNDVLKEIKKEKKPTSNVPVAGDAPLKERMEEALMRRNELCVYDEEMQDALVVHFMCYHKQRARLLTHFYGFVFFEDWKHDLWAKRFVRDHLRYLDELQCAAARVVQAIRQKSYSNNENSGGEFDSMHIRRGDFQFKQTRLDADEVYANSKDVLADGGVLYIATDERDKNFFKPFRDNYEVYFLDDFKHLFKGLNTNYYGMLDQLIVSRGRVFVGTYYSTFSGFINRLRGYEVAKYKEEGFEDGTLKSYYFAPMNMKNVMTQYTPIMDLWSREYPMSWRDIDKGIGMGDIVEAKLKQNEQEDQDMFALTR